MGFTKHLVNGVVSLVISVGITALTDDGDGWTRSEALQAVALSAFLSGLFTSYFAKSE
jgi:hypothetical protein